MVGKRIPKQKKIIVANWKMNPLSLREAMSTFSAIKKTGSVLRNVQTVVCPPSLYIIPLREKISGRRVFVGAQDIHYENSGAFTGEVSAGQMKKAGVQYAIVGHSERRASGETNESINKKIKIGLGEKLNMILCIGELVRDEQAEYLDFLRREIVEALDGVSRRDAGQILVAYEPIWAVGRNARRADTPADTQETVLFIRKVLMEIFGETFALNMPILYGGSVDKNNAVDFLKDAGVQGLLIGRASLDAAHFSSILRDVEDM